MVGIWKIGGTRWAGQQQQKEEEEEGWMDGWMGTPPPRGGGGGGGGPPTAACEIIQRGNSKITRQTFVFHNAYTYA